MEWVVRICRMCRREFDNKVLGKNDVYPENCPECCESLDHRTAVKWAEWRRRNPGKEPRDKRP